MKFNSETRVFCFEWIYFLDSPDIWKQRMKRMKEGTCVCVWEGYYCMKLDGVSLKHEHSSLLRHKALSDCCPPPPDANKHIQVSSPTQIHTHTHIHVVTYPLVRHTHTHTPSPPTYTWTYSHKLIQTPIQCLSSQTHTHTGIHSFQEARCSQRSLLVVLVIQAAVMRYRGTNRLQALWDCHS